MSLGLDSGYIRCGRRADAGEVAHGGWCVARPDEGPVIFVRHALPGERVLARVTEVTTRLARAEAIQILAASPDRVEPPCPHARPGGCGGCDWQHAALPAQRSLKAAVVRQQLRRLAGLEIAVTVEPLPGDADTEDDAGLGWRTRVQFAVRSDGVAGLRAHRSHEVIDIGRCLIAHPAITDLGTNRPTLGGRDLRRGRRRGRIGGASRHHLGGGQTWQRGGSRSPPIRSCAAPDLA